MMIPRILAVAALTSVVFGFSNTSPVIAWSSTSSTALKALPSRLQNDTNILAVVQSLVDTEDICDYDAVVIIEQPGLHAFDLRSLSAQSGLIKRVNTSPSARQYPYVHTHPEFDMLSVARTVSSKCQSRLLQVTLGNISTSFEHHSEKHLFAMVMPDISEFGKVRKNRMNADEILLSQHLDVLAGIFTDHLVIFVGSPSPSLSGFVKRQPSIPSAGTTSVGYANTSPPSILTKYQLLTPELITSLLVFFFIILPIACSGIKALASIQNTIRIDGTKSFNALEKKNQ